MADPNVTIPTGLGSELRAFVAHGTTLSAVASVVVRALSGLRLGASRAFPVLCVYRRHDGDRLKPILEEGVSAICERETLVDLASKLVLEAGPEPSRVQLLEEGEIPREASGEGVVQGVGLFVEAAEREALVVLAFARGKIAPPGMRALKLFVARIQRALLESDEVRDSVPDLTRKLAHIAILERMISCHESLAGAQDRDADLVAQNERLQRTQRAVLNVIDDLREARATLEERVRERTRRLSELLEERDAVLAKEQRARIDAEAARAQAETANRMKDEFLSTVSHELRTPLTAIVGWTQLLRGRRMPEEKHAAGLEIIERNARAQVRLVEDLLDFGRLVQGKFRLAVGPIEVVRIVDTVLESLRPAAEAKDVRIQRTLDSHATIVGDGERLQQVVWNLVSNAIKFTPKGGRVHVTLRRASSYVELVVADTGVGIAPEFLTHVFEPFRQADGSMSRRSGGLGLGLSIVHSLVELHGGTVTAASDGAGKGATFTVRIPVAPVRASVPDSEPSTSLSSPPEFDRPALLEGVKALVVDDEEDTRDLIGYVLEQCSVRVTLAGSTEDAMARLDEQRFDVIVSDVGMPGEDGHAFLRRVRARSPETGGRTPALALTAYSRSEDRAAAIRAGFDSHLAKPVDASELTLTVAALVRNQR